MLRSAYRDKCARPSTPLRWSLNSENANCRVPAYYALILRSLTVLEGLALSSDPGYKLLAKASFLSIHLSPVLPVSIFYNVFVTLNPNILTVKAYIYHPIIHELDCGMFQAYPYVARRLLTDPEPQLRYPLCKISESSALIALLSDI